ncbi:MAG: hypothetical protein COX19_02800 [Desulfobacterales bacterium CG23_combo_of_CG06-09_8_20_14_all_51_8]|nr:MAG: hypothetical protein COX19_02800 [Desulfobacterales bacterium CG23_combo_of_CG06-09_8_20_14_all_51_8]
MIQPAALIVYDTDTPVRNFFFFAAISLLCHVVVFILVAWVHLPGDFSRKIELPPPAIDLDLVAFNPETPLPPARGENPKVAPSAPAESRVEKSVTPIQAPILEPEPELLPIKKGLQKKKNPADYAVEKPRKPEKPPITKKPVTEKQIDTAKVIENAVKRIEKQSEATQAKSVSDRIESLRHEVLNQTGKLSQVSSSSVGSGSSYPRDFTQIEIFQAEVSVRLKNNWVFSEKLAGETKGLESRLVIKILPDGSITDVWFEKRSGNDYLDNSAYKTVMKSNPLPPLPAGFPYYHLVLGFTPSGLHQQ